jgi:predicted heme/steroid binding protein/uncharacterized membrane protein
LSEGSSEPGGRRLFTSEELSRYDGRDGRKAFVAVDGKVYDVTPSAMWKQGEHFRLHGSGGDLSRSIGAAPHGKEVLERLEQVGILAEEPNLRATKRPERPSWLSALILRHHAHPMLIHFPTAFCTVASFTALLYLALRVEVLESFALYCVVISALATPPSIVTGLVSWRYSYGGVRTPLFRAKIRLSAGLAVLLFAALAVRFAAVDGPDSTPAAFWVYQALVLALAPTVIRLGYVGGRITFPS